jgi:hypothetical protein
MAKLQARGFNPGDRPTKRIALKGRKIQESSTLAGGMALSLHGEIWDVLNRSSFAPSASPTRWAGVLRGGNTSFFGGAGRSVC